MMPEVREWYDIAAVDLGVAKLLNQIKNKLPIEDKYYDYADMLTPYGVSVRYPNELFLEERHAKEALQFADEILNWVKGIVEQTPCRRMDSPFA